jgi:hypothetical protein
MGEWPPLFTAISVCTPSPNNGDLIGGGDALILFCNEGPYHFPFNGMVLLRDAGVALMYPFMLFCIFSFERITIRVAGFSFREPYSSPIS